MGARIWMVVVLAAGLGACRGGGDPLEGKPIGDGAGGAGGDPGMGGAPGMGGDPGMGGMGGGLACDAPAPARLGCPEPGELPFETEATMFDDPELVESLAPFPEFKLQNQDSLVNPADAQSLPGRMAKGKSLNTRPFPEEWVSLWTWNAAGEWTQLARQRTDEDGKYTFDLTGDDSFGLGLHTTYAVLEGDGTCAEHIIANWPAGTQVLVTDIDETLTTADSELIRQIGDPSYEPQRRPGAQLLLNTWVEKGYKVVYLTARPHDFRVPTRKWLNDHGFPLGPVVTADSLVFGDSAVRYKGAFLTRVVDELQWDVVVAYGNADSDIEAYEQAGIPKEITYIIGEKAGTQGTQPVADGDYTNHIATYVEAQRDARQPFAEDEPFCR